MKILLLTLSFFFASVSTQVMAHSDHGHINGQAAVSIAEHSLLKLTFKDLGFEVGKLDQSWKNTSRDQVSIIEIKDDFYIISAKNIKNNKTIYMKIGNNGQLFDVKYTNSF